VTSSPAYTHFGNVWRNSTCLISEPHHIVSKVNELLHVVHIGLIRHCIYPFK